MQFSDIITFTRASGGGIFNAQGQYEWLPANTPRIDYDPVTGECRGLLIEEQRTNLLTYSSDFANAAWGKTGAVVAGNAYTSPSGLQDACSVSNTPGVNSFVRQSNTLLASTTYTRSVFAKHVTGEPQLVFEYTIGGSVSVARFNLATGTVVNQGSLGSASATITPAGNGWYRCTHTFTTAASGTNSANVFYIGTFGPTATETTFALWGAQLEAGAFPTSYIPTTTAQVTRAADIASVNELSPWYRADEGTIFVEVGSFNGFAARALTFHNGTANGQIWFQPSSSNSFAGYNGTFQWANPHASGVGKMAGAYRTNDIASSKNGSTAVIDTNAVIPDITTLRIGAGWNGQVELNGHIRSLRYYPRRISNTELQALTA